MDSEGVSVCILEGVRMSQSYSNTRPHEQGGQCVGARRAVVRQNPEVVSISIFLKKKKHFEVSSTRQRSAAAAYLMANGVRNSTLSPLPMTSLLHRF